MNMAVSWTREQFEAEYNGGDWSAALEHGRLSIECHEGHSEDVGCHGWKMTSLTWLDDDLTLYGNTQAEVDAAIEHRNELLKPTAPTPRASEEHVEDEG